MNTARMLAEVILQPISAAAAAAALPMQSIAASSNPVVFTAPRDGSLSVQGGTVSLVSFSRGGTAITLGLTGGLIPMATGDKVSITWVLTAPTLNFIPR